MNSNVEEIHGSNTPYNQEVGMLGFVSEEWCTNQIVVQSRHRLARIDVAKLHEWRFVLRL